MVEEQLHARGIRDPRVLDAMAGVPRHLFVPADRRAEAYADSPVPIGAGQTISQPYIVALMLEQLRLRPGLKVLEVGTGSGYQTALLARMGAHVFSVERIPELAEGARKRIEELGVTDARLRVGDGSLGWPEEQPFDRIIVTASAPRLPQALADQLVPGGILVIPVGEGLSQTLVAAAREGGQIRTRSVCECVFVPLIGSQGWRGDDPEDT
ncbi:MAG: protein-L-isoaspartate(D-aspartate) O-methyltransferase [Candidatus Omnitrophica bacterium]|nr:protein-L-isoaspartate(D-aspartate) O-methyltransferase [Candidatus Omnitrophota bacterium]